MPWVNRVKEGAFTSPTGIRIPFEYVEVSREIQLRTTEFEFQGIDDGWQQQNGHGARKYPLVCIFSGPEHDRRATQFELALLERGIGQLEHPLYGTFPAVPTGTITRRNDLVNGNNQSVVEVTFSTTLAAVYPSGVGYPRSEILDSINSFEIAAAAQFAAAADLKSAVAKANFKGTLRAVLSEIRGAFDKFNGITSTARRALAEEQARINEAMDVLVGEPLKLAQQVSGLVLAPARMIEGFKSRLEGYGLMARGIIANHSSTLGDSSSIPETVRGKRNEAHLVDLVTLTATAGSVLSTVQSSSPSSSASSAPTKFSTRPEALQGAEGILDQIDEVIVWRDQRLDQLGVIDTGTAYSALRDAAMQAAGYLVETSFDLIPERRVVLERDRTIIDLCAELYGSVSNERLDFLIASNDLTGNQILELKRGSLIKYYAA